MHPPPSAPAEHTAQSSALWRQRHALSIATWLALACAAVLVVFLIGNLLAHHSTRVTTASITRVEQRFEPIVSLARELGASIGAFERAVLGYLKFDNPESRDAVGAASHSLLAALAVYENIQHPEGDPSVDASLRDPIAEFHRDGLWLIEMQRQRRSSTGAYWAALDRLRGRILGAGAGGLRAPGDDVVFARRSLSELARAAAAMRDSASDQFSAATAAKVAAAARDEAAFRVVLRKHAPELGRSPGAAWLEMLGLDLAEATRQRQTVARLDSELENSRLLLAASAARLESDVEARLLEPAWRALTESAGRARVTAEDAERTIGWVSAIVLLVVLLICAAAAYGITVPVRRLTKGTRALARGALATRVARGGVRELDELAQAFNYMAERLDASEKTVRSYQAQLENRVAERTRQLRHLAHHDPLTDLPNRRQLFSYLNSAITQISGTGGHRLAVLFIDLDNFKTLNDSLGHEFGDTVLRAIGQRLQSVAGAADFVARFGGDEFTVVLTTEATAADIEERVSRLIAEFQRPLPVQPREVLVGVSIGVAICPDHCTDAESLLRAADAALFRAKELGRNRFSVYSPDLLDKATMRFRTEQALRQACEAGELQLFFQPEVSLATLETSVAEALLRWQRPDGTVVPAAEFLAVAEQSGLLLELNEWVLRHAGETLRNWRCGRWPSARIAINVSSHQFLGGNFVSAIEKLLHATGLPAHCLEIELTETVLQTGAVTVETLHSLRMLGVTVALDDFGTGYSSLTSLEQLPLDRVKLDRSLIADVDTSPRAGAIARSIVGLCRNLGLQVTAEGVERPGQLEFLVGCGNVYVQGYLVAAPAAAEEALNLMSAGFTHLATIRDAALANAFSATRESTAAVTVLRPGAR